MNRLLLTLLASASLLIALAPVACSGEDASSRSDTAGTDTDTDARNDRDASDATRDAAGPPPCDDPPQSEICDGRDNDCNGVIDDAFILACEPCPEGDCILATVLGGGWSNGIKRNLRDGNDIGIALPQPPKRSDHIYIANSADDTVSKLRTKDGVEIARVAVGNNPSRTAVDGDANGWVVMRGNLNDDSKDGELENVVKIDGDCVPEIAPPVATRECILLDIPEVGNLLRGVAIDAKGDAWIGAHGSQEVIKLHGPTGIELARVDVADEPEMRPYGLAVDEHGYIWIVALFGDAYVARIDPVTNKRDLSLTPEDLENNQPYGIAADGDGGIWFGSRRNNIFTVSNETLAFDRRLVIEGGRATRGVAVGDGGYIWVADSGADAVHRVDPVTEDAITIMVGNGPVGVAVDHDGFIWAANEYSHDAYKLDVDGETLGTYPVGHVPYTYSDMTGSAFRVFRRLRGVYTAAFDSGVPGAIWSALRFRGAIPDKAAVEMRVRAGDGDDDKGAWGPVTLDGREGSFAAVTGAEIEVEIVLRTEAREAIPNVDRLTFTFTRP